MALWQSDSKYPIDNEGKIDNPIINVNFKKNYLNF